MNIQAIKTLMDKIDTKWHELDRNVFHVYGEALENAGLTCKENGEPAHNGAFYSDEFYRYFRGSLETLLACSDIVTPGGRAFFEAEGVKY